MAAKYIQVKMCILRVNQRGGIDMGVSSNKIGAIKDEYS